MDPSRGCPWPEGTGGSTLRGLSSAVTVQEVGPTVGRRSLVRDPCVRAPPPYPPGDPPTRSPPCPQTAPRHSPAVPIQRQRRGPSHSHGCPRPGSAVRCPRASVSPGGAGAPPGAGSCARCRPALPRLTSPARRVQSPVRTPRLPLLAHPPGSPADTGQQQPRPRPKAESIGTVRGSPRRPAAATPTPLR